MSGDIPHHSCAIIEAGERGLADVLSSEFEPAPDVLASVLTCCDMTTSPDGEPVPVGRRLAEIHCPVTSKIPRRASLTCQEESVLSIFARQRVRFARFACLGAVTRDSEVCLPGRLGDHFGRFPGCMNVSVSGPSAAGRGKLSGRRRRSSTTNWQKGKFDVIGQSPSRPDDIAPRIGCPIPSNVSHREPG